MGNMICLWKEKRKTASSFLNWMHFTKQAMPLCWATGQRFPEQLAAAALSTKILLSSLKFPQNMFLSRPCSPWPLADGVWFQGQSFPLYTCISFVVYSLNRKGIKWLDSRSLLAFGPCGILDTIWPHDCRWHRSSVRKNTMAHLHVSLCTVCMVPGPSVCRSPWGGPLHFS